MTFLKKKPPITRVNTELKNRLTTDIKHRYANKDLIQHIEANIDGTTMRIKLDLLHFFKKILQQVQRSLYPDQKLAFEELSDQQIIEFDEEQDFYNPIKWINAEIEYLVFKKQTGSDRSDDISHLSSVDHRNLIPKDWLTKEQVMSMLGMSRSTLQRRIDDGLPVYKNGKKIYLIYEEVGDFILKK